MRSLVPLLLALALAACTDRDAATTYPDQMAEQHAGDSPAPTGLAVRPGAGGDIVTARPVYARLGDTDVTGYLARPGTADTTGAPALVVIHEWWGLNDNIRAMTERLAEQGYVALAVDLYGAEAATPEEAQRLMGAAMERPETLLENLRAAHDYLLREEGAGPVGVIGWCFGGHWALRTALAQPDSLDAAVIYYGRLVTDPEALRPLEMPILGIFGEEDASIPVEQVQAFEQALTQLGKDVQIEVYPGAGHAFANPSGERYVAEAAEDAWQKTLAFLDEHLKTPGTQ